MRFPALTPIAAAAILACSAAHAAEPPAQPSATPVKHPSIKVCNKQADARHLSGNARTEFVSNCHAGKPAKSP